MYMYIYVILILSVSYTIKSKQFRYSFQIKIMSRLLKTCLMIIIVNKRKMYGNIAQTSLSRLLNKHIMTEMEN